MASSDGVVIVVLGKGGSSKTATVGILGPALAEHGRRVALVDLDPDAILTDWLARDEDREAGVDDVLAGTLAVDQVTVPLRDGLDLVPAMEGLIDREQQPDLVAAMRALFASLRSSYDIVLVDTRGSIRSLLNIAAVEAGDFVLVPMQPAGGNLRATRVALTTASDCRTPVLGILPSRAGRGNMAKESIGLLQASGYHVFPAIPQNVKADEARPIGLPLGEYAPKSPAWLAYQDVAAGVIKALAKEAARG